MNILSLALRGHCKKCSNQQKNKGTASMVQCQFGKSKNQLDALLLSLALERLKMLSKPITL